MKKISPANSNGQEAEGPDHFHQPTTRQCALLILRLMQAREQEVHRELSRARISQSTLRRLCGRSQISNDFLLEIQEFLLHAGWALFCIGPTHYAIIKLQAAQGWGRISSKRIEDELTQVAHGQYDFGQLDPLLLQQEPKPEDEDDYYPV
jgi:hypothetical protein